MPLRITIPESQQIRRLAGALSSALSRRTRSGRLDDFSLSVGNYFRQFPWTKQQPRVSALLPRLEECTVGQYFAVFDWREQPGRPSADRASHVTERSTSNTTIPSLNEPLLDLN